MHRVIPYRPGLLGLLRLGTAGLGLGYLARGAQQRSCRKQVAGKAGQQVRIAEHVKQYIGFPATMQLPGKAAAI